MQMWWQWASEEEEENEVAAVNVIVADLTFTGPLLRLAARGSVWFEQCLGFYTSWGFFFFFLQLNLFSIVFVFFERESTVGG